MRLKAVITGDLEQVMAKEYDLASRAVTAGVGKRTGILKTDLRSQITRARLGGRLAKAWRGRVYENEGINAAGFVWSKAPKIIRAFDEGVTIRAKGGRWLAIPTEHAPKRGMSAGGRSSMSRRISPTSYVWRDRLRFVPINPRLALLVERKRGNRKTLVMFILVKQVKLKKRLDVKGAGLAAADTLPRDILDAFRRLDSHGDTALGGAIQPVLCAGGHAGPENPAQCRTAGDRSTGRADHPARWHDG